MSAHVDILPEGQQWRITISADPGESVARFAFHIPQVALALAVRGRLLCRIIRAVRRLR